MSGRKASQSIVRKIRSVVIANETGKKSETVIVSHATSTSTSKQRQRRRRRSLVHHASHSTLCFFSMKIYLYT